MAKRNINAILAALLCAGVLSACGQPAASSDASAQPASSDASVQATAEATAETGTETKKAFSYTFATKAEGEKLMEENTIYFDSLTQNDLDFRLAKKGATLEEFKDLTITSVTEFSEAEKGLVNDYMAQIEEIVKENGYQIPPIDEIHFVNMTGEAEGPAAAAYTFGTTVCFNRDFLGFLLNNGHDTHGNEAIFAHELFHCLTRCCPEFRKEMYSIIHFTVGDREFEIPASAKDYYLSNPDVEHHDSYATFMIDGKPVDCFTAWISTQHWEKEGDMFYDYGITALCPIDGTDTYYTQEQASNFDEVFGTNTDYVIDPEECMADNFCYAIMYGREGYEGKGYPNPEIIDAIIAKLQEGPWMK